MSSELLTFEERSNYNMLSDDEEKAFEAGQTLALEKLGDLVELASETGKDLENVIWEFLENRGEV